MIFWKQQTVTLAILCTGLLQACLFSTPPKIIYSSHTFTESDPSLGHFHTETATLTSWSWTQTVSKGDPLVEGVHYTLSGTNLPAELDLHITKEDTKTLLLNIQGEPLHHHARDNIEGIQLTFLPSAFYAQNEKIASHNPISQTLSIRYGDPYSLGGTIDGLNSPLQLILNDGLETIDIVPEDAKFQFAHVFEEGEVYDVVFATQPTNTCCQLDLPNGTFETTSIELGLSCTSINWAFPTSTTPFPQAPELHAQDMGTLLSNKLHAIDTNAQGDVIYAWLDKPTHQGAQAESAAVFVSLLDAQTKTWSYPTAIDSSDPFFIHPPTTEGIRPSREPRVVMGDTGDAMVGWIGESFTGRQIYVAFYRDGVWQQPLNLEAHISQSATNLERFEMDFSSHTDQAILAWNDHLGPNDLHRSVFDQGLWSAPEKVNILNQPVLDYDVGVHKDGFMVLSWIQHNPNAAQDHLWISTYDNGTWTPQTATVEDAYQLYTNSYDISEVEVHFRDDGLPGYISWDQVLEFPPNIFYYGIHIEKYENGTLQPAHQWSPYTNLNNKVSNLTMDVSRSGDLLHAWTYPGATSNLQVYRAKKSFSGQAIEDYSFQITPINTHAPDNLRNLQVSLGAFGRGQISWVEGSSFEPKVYWDTMEKGLWNVSSFNAQDDWKPFEFSEPLFHPLLSSGGFCGEQSALWIHPTPSGPSRPFRASFAP